MALSTFTLCKLQAQSISRIWLKVILLIAFQNKKTFKNFPRNSWSKSENMEDTTSVSIHVGASMILLHGPATEVSKGFDCILRKMGCD